MPSAVLGPLLASLLDTAPAAQAVVTLPVESMSSASGATADVAFDQPPWPELSRGARRPR
ncbi:MAG TPA: hypothetical protein VII13_11560 [Vicinamibacteria bacterium]|jgi:hypothetical protein